MKRQKTLDNEFLQRVTDKYNLSNNSTSSFGEWVIDNYSTRSWRKSILELFKRHLSEFEKKMPLKNTAYFTMYHNNVWFIANQDTMTIEEFINELINNSCNTKKKN